MWEANLPLGSSMIFSSFERKAELYLDRGDRRSDEKRVDRYADFFSRMSLVRQSGFTCVKVTNWIYLLRTNIYRYVLADCVLGCKA